MATPDTPASTAPLTLDEIPGPRALPVLGNVFDIDTADPLGGFVRMAVEYGPIFKLVTPGVVRLMVSGPELVDELCDDTRFDKALGGGLSKLRAGPVDSGLFTADTDDPLWRRAHDILMSPFSQQAMRDYMPEMVDIAEQLMDKWSRLNPGEEVDVTADMTRLTLDTIALCGFGYRFNSFYRDTAHPFVAAMMRVLTESQARVRQLPIQTRLRVRAQRQFDEDQRFMSDLVDRIIAERRAEGDAAESSDLLGRMLTGVDKQTGEGLPDENIRAQCITFLVAGHETTSGLLSFAIYFLLKNPDVLARARTEVDSVLGTTAAPTFEQVHRLTYIRQILDEALRLWPTAPGFTRQPRQDTVIGGRYAVPAQHPGHRVEPGAAPAHRDLGSRRRRVQPRPHRTRAHGHDPPVRLQALRQRAAGVHRTTVRDPGGRAGARHARAAVRVRRPPPLPAHGQDHTHGQARRLPHPGAVPGGGAPRPHCTRAAEPRPAFRRRGSAVAPLVARHGTPLSVLFGSNLGTAESIATRLAQEGTERGFDVTLGALDDHVDDLPPDGAALVVCSSYNGTPPDNAAAFCRWITGADGGAADGVAYTVFGCGNTEWAGTYQAVPTLLDDQLAGHGGRRVRPRGEGNAAGDFDAAYRDWHSGLWSDLASALDLPAKVGEPAVPAGPRLSITLTNRQVTNPVIVSYQARPSTVRANRELIAGTAASRRSAPPVTSRSPSPEAPATGRATTSGCSRATPSTSSAG